MKSNTFKIKKKIILCAEKIKAKLLSEVNDYSYFFIVKCQTTKNIFLEENWSVYSFIKRTHYWLNAYLVFD